MTEYRAICDGYCNFLQYKETKKFLWFKRTKWTNVWRPYFHRSWGRDDILGHDIFITSYTTNLPSFVKKWPNIETYFEWANEEQQRLVKNAQEKIASVEAKRGVITNLTNS